MGLISLAGGDYAKAYECYNILAKVSRPSLSPSPSFTHRLVQKSDDSKQESNWSKATYAYAKGVSLLESGEDEDLAGENLELVSSLMQRIVGKSIPLEVSSSFPIIPPSTSLTLTAREYEDNTDISTILEIRSPQST